MQGGDYTYDEDMMNRLRIAAEKVGRWMTEGNVLHISGEGAE